MLAIDNVGGMDVIRHQNEVVHRYIDVVANQVVQF
jgi:hypothetical protein